MTAMVTNGHGGFDQLEYRHDVPTPIPGTGEVLVRVTACGMNNTDINTRTAWYSSAVDDGITTAGVAEGFAGADADDGSWRRESLRFPLIQGADAVGYVAAVGPGGDEEIVGDRVMIDPWFLDPHDPSDLEGSSYFGSEIDGGFAEFAKAPAGNIHQVTSELSDVELATFPCAFTTAENLISQAHVGDKDVVVITGASGGVGTAAIQLCRERGATIIAVATATKADELLALGAAAVIDRQATDIASEIRRAAPGGRIDAVADVVGGRIFESLVPLLRRGGRYATSGAIAGPIAELDLRLLIYRDLHFSGATVCPPGTMAKVMALINTGRIQPTLAAVYPLAEMEKAQEVFATKRHTGKFVLDLETLRSGRDHQ